VEKNDEIVLAVTGDTTSLTKSKAVVNQFIDESTGQFKKLDNAVDKTNKRLSENNGLSGSLRKLRQSFKLQKGAVQQAGFQVQDFAVQVSGGTSALVAFGQQGSQLAGLLGPGGAVIGAVIAIGAAIGGPLVNSLFSATEEVKDLKGELEKLAKTQILSADQAKFLAQIEGKSSEEKRKLREETKKQIKLNEELVKKATTDGVGLDTGQFAVPRSAAKNQEKYAEKIKETNAELVDQRSLVSFLTGKIEESDKKIQQYNQTAQGGTIRTQEQAEAIRKYIGTLQEQVRAIGKSDREIALSRDGLLEGEKKAINAAFDLIDADKQKAEQTRVNAAEELKRSTALNTVNQSLQRKIVALTGTGAAQDEYNAKLRLGLSQEQALPEAIQMQITKIAELTDAKNKAAKEDERRSQVLAQFENVGGGSSELERIQKQFEEERAVILEHQAIRLQDESLGFLEKEAVRQQHEDKLTQIEDQAAKAREAITQRERQSKLAAVSSAFSGLANLMNAGSKKLFKIGKAAALANAAVDAYASVTGAYKVGARIGGPPIGAAFATAAGIAQAVNIANIAKQKIGGGTAANAGSFSGGLPAVNTAPAGGGAQAPDQTISITGLNPGDLFTGSQVQALFGAINGGLADGLTFNTN
jgi:hypothetical protein